VVLSAASFKKKIMGFFFKWEVKCSKMAGKMQQKMLQFNSR
jgi:hypothetical protein